MAGYGILGGQPYIPGLSDFRVAQGDAQRTQAHQLQQRLGILGMQKTMQDMEAAQQKQGYINQAMEAIPQAERPMFALDPAGYGHRKDDQAFRERESQARREERREALEMRLNDQRTSREERAALQRELQQMQIQGRQDMMRLGASLRPPRQPQSPVAIVGPDGKPVYVTPDQAVGQRPFDRKSGQGLPQSMMKLQNEILEDVGTAGAIDADLGAISLQLQTGELNLGPVSNLTSQARNFLGASNEQSQNFQSFKSTLEKLRNDSLRLNKGVQTEGDSQRAWNELIANMNDPKVVAKRLDEIRKINQRGANLKRLQLDTMRSNFGADPMDVTPFTQQQPAVGTPQRRSTDSDPLGIR